MWAEVVIAVGAFLFIAVFIKFVIDMEEENEKEHGKNK